MPGSEVSGETVSEKHRETAVESQLCVHTMMLFLERQAEHVDTQAWLCKQE